MRVWPLLGLWTSVGIIKAGKIYYFVKMKYILPVFP